jgi:hypothetical protein
MMLDGHAENAKSDYELAELVSRVNNFYTKKGLSPPFFLRDAAREWHGLSQEEIVAVLEKHFAEHRRLYTGASDRYFHMVQAAVHRAIEAKRPRDRADDGLNRPRRRSSGRVRTVPTVGGIPDVYVEGRAARDVRRAESERPSLAGYTGERVGIANLEDDEADP